MSPGIQPSPPKRPPCPTQPTRAGKPVLIAQPGRGGLRDGRAREHRRPASSARRSPGRPPEVSIRDAGDVPIAPDSAHATPELPTSTDHRPAVLQRVVPGPYARERLAPSDQTTTRTAAQQAGLTRSRSDAALLTASPTSSGLPALLSAAAVSEPDSALEGSRPPVSAEGRRTGPWQPRGPALLQRPGGPCAIIGVRSATGWAGMEGPGYGRRERAAVEGRQGGAGGCHPAEGPRLQGAQGPAALDHREPRARRGRPTDHHRGVRPLGHQLGEIGRQATGPARTGPGGQTRRDRAQTRRSTQQHPPAGSDIRRDGIPLHRG